MLKTQIQLPDGNTPAQDFVEIKQGPNEPYMKFIGHLKLAIEGQNQQAEAWRGFQIMRSYTLHTSARPHDLGKKTYGSATVRNLFLG